MVNRVVVFVHGWSVFETKTYGKLPERLAMEAEARRLDIAIEHVWLGKYVSFRDEVRLDDISRAFENALRGEAGIRDALAQKARLSIITHSTGGPVVRDWWWRFYGSTGKTCPMSHLIMLAPANFGSALAQLGKGTLGRIMARFDQVEPGQGVLDWLELGSHEAWELNEAWIRSAPSWKADPAVFPFVLTGQWIDRKLYDHVNSYTDEMGSDGVVRVAAANLNATYIRLEQQWAAEAGAATSLNPGTPKVSPRTAFCIVPGRSHSGTDMGIMASVRKNKPHPTIDALMRCLLVGDAAAYEKLCDAFDAENALTQKHEQVETEKTLFILKRHFIHDRTSMLLVRLRDDHDRPLEDFDFLLTACDPDNPVPKLRLPDPNQLPPGFFIDRQGNKRDKGMLTYLIDYDVMHGCPELKDDDGDVVRQAQPGAQTLGLRIIARPQPDPGNKKSELLAHFVTAELAADAKALAQFVKPNQTILLDISLKRVVREGVFRLTRGKTGEDFKNEDFRGQPPGAPFE